MYTLLAVLALISAGDKPSDEPAYYFEKWKVVSTRQLDVRPGDYLKALVGLVVVYQNPENDKEFAKVYYRQVGLVSERPNENKRESEGGRSSLIGNSGYTYHVREEQEAIERVQKAKDIFAYVRWNVTVDPRTGQQILDGDVTYSLLNWRGEWSLISSSYLGDIVERPISEPSKFKKGLRVIVGFRFQLRLHDSYHIIRIDQDDLVAAEKGKKENKNAR